MTANIPIAIGAGLLAASILRAAVMAPPLLAGPMLASVALPLAVAGLSTNAATGFTALGVCALLLAAVTGLASSLLFVLACGLPMAVLVHRALLHRDSDAGGIEWYPIGRIVIIAAVMSAAVISLGLLLASHGGDIERLESAVRLGLDRMIETGMAGLPGSGPLSDEDKVRLTTMMRDLLPGTASAFWMLCLLGGLWLAGRIALAAHRLARPWPDLAAIHFPVGTPLVLAAGLLGSVLLDGVPRLMALGFAAAIFAAYVLLGLAIVHWTTRGFPWRAGALAAVYVACFGATSVAAIGLALLGLADGLTPLRRPPAPSP